MAERRATGVTKWILAYEKRLPMQRVFTQKLGDLIQELLGGAGVDVLFVEARTKTLESLEGKLVRDLDYYTDPMSQVIDLTGIRVVVYYSHSIQDVAEVLRTEFDIDEASSVDHSSALPTDRFGYRSRHFALRLGNNRADLAEWLPYRALIAEVQVRTGLEHAWAAVSHKVMYKSDRSAPVFLQRGLARVSAMLEVADEEFSRLGRETNAVRETYDRRLEGGDLDVEVDSLSIDVYLDSDLVQNRLSELAGSAGWSLLTADHLDPLFTRDRNDLLQVVDSLGIASIHDLETLLSDARVPEVVQELRNAQESRRSLLPITVDDLITRVLLVLRDAPRELYQTLYDRPVVASIRETIGRSRPS